MCICLKVSGLGCSKKSGKVELIKAKSSRSFSTKLWVENAFVVGRYGVGSSMVVQVLQVMVVV